MSSESRIILEMLKEGKIDSSEAERLLHALGGTKAEGKNGGRGHYRRSSRRNRHFNGASLWFHGLDLARTLQDTLHSIGDAVDSAIRSKTGRFRDPDGENAADGDDWKAQRQKETAEESWSGSLTAEGLRRLGIETPNGSVRVVAAEGDIIAIRAEKVVRSRDAAQAKAFPAQMRVETHSEGDSCRIYAEIPTRPKGLDAEVRFHIQCPPHLVLTVHSGNGALDLQGTTTDVTAETLNGNITLAGARGRIALRTNNGDIQARIDALTREGNLACANGNLKVEILSGVAPLSVKTFNGAIDVTLPADFKGQLDAYTANGPIDCEGVAVKGGKGKSSARGPIGGGGDAAVALRTMNGSISLRSKNGRR